ATAISVLATIDTPESLATLRDLLEDDDDDVVRAVIAALSTLATDEARDLLISTALSDRNDAAGRATEALLGMSGPDVEQALVEVVKAHPKDKPDVLRHLITIGSKEGTALAASLAHSSDEDERILAIRVFAEAGTAEALETALSLVRAQHGETKVAALRLLSAAQPGDPSVTELLRDTVRTGTSEEATAALGVLARAGTNEARDAVLGALNSSDADVASAAVAALEKFRLTPDSAMALRAVADAHPELARNVMQQLLNMGSAAGVQIAEKLLQKTSDRYEAESMFRALASAGTPEANDVLVRSAKAGDPEIRAVALRSLANDKTSLEIATQSLRDSSQVVREAAALTLGSSHTDAARDALLQFARSNDVYDRRSAVNALRDVSDPRITQRLLEMTRDPDAAVSMMAVDALPDTSETAARLRSLVGDAGASYDLRVRAAQTLRYRGRLDESTGHIAEQLESTYEYSE
ncbi:MAG TPA: HEAT repeat domain-containing protein, partial [Kofleriaceae bacterium]|nr:HEAT repeat domain-containing protein [Kofleriaceae bacterium]